MNTICLEPNQVPKCLLNGYKGRKFEAKICESVTLHDTSWSGGTRSTYTMVHIETGKQAPIPGNPAPTHFGGNMEGNKIELKPDFAIVKHCIFCGKDMGLTFYIHPNNAPRFLPEQNNNDLSIVDRLVLTYTATRKSSYNGQDRYGMMKSDFKWHNANDWKLDNVPSREQWDAAKNKLIDLKYLNKRGAITISGRNFHNNNELRN